MGGKKGLKGREEELVLGAQTPADLPDFFGADAEQNYILPRKSVDSFHQTWSIIC